MLRANGLAAAARSRLTWRAPYAAGTCVESACRSVWFIEREP
jgi:hypothetical protein